jgi:hypothetical protein
LRDAEAVVFNGIILPSSISAASEPGHLGVGQNDGMTRLELFQVLPSGC